MYHVASLNSIVYTYIYDSVIHLDLTLTLFFDIIKQYNLHGLIIQAILFD